MGNKSASIEGRELTWREIRNRDRSMKDLSNPPKKYYHIFYIILGESGGTTENWNKTN